MNKMAAVDGHPLWMAFQSGYFAPIIFNFFEFIIFKDSPTGKNPDRGGLHREVVRK